MKVVVIGTFNVDYVGETIFPLKRGESHPGNIKISAGGVARNIVENLARLGMKVTFITAVGSDAYGIKYKKDLEELKVKFIIPGHNDNALTSTYLAVNNNKGELEYAVVETAILDYLSHQHFENLIGEINKNDMVILDANLRSDTINYLLENVTAMIIGDAVSAIKAQKYIEHLDKFFLLKVNSHEKEVINEALKEKRPKNLIITAGKHDLIYERKDALNGIVSKSFTPKKVSNIVSTTGAGDALLAGIIYAVSNYQSVEKGIELGMAMSALTLQIAGAVNPNIIKVLQDKN